MPSSCLLVALVTSCPLKCVQVSSVSCTNYCYYDYWLDVFRLLMNGMEHHMNNPISNYRLLAMRLAECVSQQLKKDGSPLKFDVSCLTM